MNNWIRSGSLAFGLLVGCSGGGGGLGGVPGNTQLADITDEQSEDLCIAGSTLINDIASNARVIRGLCSIFALGEELSGDACTMAVDECAMSDEFEPEPAEDIAEDCQGATADEFDGCNATVAELSQCLRDSIAVIEDTLGGVTCSSTEFPDEPATPASCSSLPAGCDDFVVDPGDFLDF